MEGPGDPHDRNLQFLKRRASVSSESLESKVVRANDRLDSPAGRPAPSDKDPLPDKKNVESDLLLKQLVVEAVADAFKASGVSLLAERVKQEIRAELRSSVQALRPVAKRHGNSDEGLRSTLLTKLRRDDEEDSIWVGKHAKIGWDDDTLGISEEDDNTPAEVRARRLKKQFKKSKSLYVEAPSAPSPLAGVVHRSFRRAQSNLLAEQDISSVPLARLPIEEGCEKSDSLRLQEAAEHQDLPKKKDTSAALNKFRKVGAMPGVIRMFRKVSDGSLLDEGGREQAGSKEASVSAGGNMDAQWASSEEPTGLLPDALHSPSNDVAPHGVRFRTNSKPKAREALSRRDTANFRGKMPSERDELDDLDDDEASFVGGKKPSSLQWRLRRAVNSLPFDMTIAVLLLANATFMGIQTEHHARYGMKSNPAYFNVVGLFFLAVFGIELALRIYAHRRDFWTGPLWAWNWFDCFMVGLQVFEELMALVSVILAKEVSTINISFLRMIRTARLIRVIRIIRIMRLISELRTILSSIVGSLKFLGWTLILFVGVVYMFAICLTQLVVESYDAKGLIGTASVIIGTVGERGDAASFFGSLPQSMSVLFQCITGGVDWGEVMSPLVTQVHWSMAYLFPLYITFGVLALMNVITGIFVETSLLSAKKDKDFFMVNNVRELFKKANVDAEEGMSWDSFVDLLDRPEMVNYFKALELDISEARGLFKLLDMDSSGTINAEEFLHGCLRFRGPARALDLALIMREVRRISRDVRTLQELTIDGIDEASQAPAVSEAQSEDAVAQESDQASSFERNPYAADFGRRTSAASSGTSPDSPGVGFSSASTSAGPSGGELGKIPSRRNIGSVACIMEQDEEYDNMQRGLSGSRKLSTTGSRRSGLVGHTREQLPGQLDDRLPPLSGVMPEFGSEAAPSSPISPLSPRRKE